jgi:hypothetical protein
MGWHIVSARSVNFANDASQDSLESQVATCDFQVGVADAGLEDADEGFP